MDMFAYPKQAEFNRAIPKNKIYAHAKPSKRIRELFVSEVGEIIWRYKLSPETINLPARDGFREIQVFDIHLKTPELDEAVLAAIDKAIPFPLVVRLIHGEVMWSSVSFKRPSEADSSKWVIEGRFRSGPFPLNSNLKELPVAIDLAGLFEQIIRSHIPLPAREAESLAEHFARFTAFETKRRTQQQLEARIAREKQFNRKVELNAELRRLQRELSTLS